MADEGNPGTQGGARKERDTLAIIAAYIGLEDLVARQDDVMIVDQSVGKRDRAVNATDGS